MMANGRVIPSLTPSRPEFDNYSRVVDTASVCAHVPGESAFSKRIARAASQLEGLWPSDPEAPRRLLSRVQHNTAGRLGIPGLRTIKVSF